jgi:hypothetical protein
MLAYSQLQVTFSVKNVEETNVFLSLRDHFQNEYFEYKSAQADDSGRAV